MQKPNSYILFFIQNSVQKNNIQNMQNFYNSFKIKQCFVNKIILLFKKHTVLPLRKENYHPPPPWGTNVLFI